MTRFLWALLLVLALITRLSAQTYAATLLKSDFNAASPPAWPDAAASAAPRTLSATVAVQPVGTVDAVNTTQASGALLLTVRGVPSAPRKWRTALVSGLLPVSNFETNLGKLTLSLSLSASTVCPVAVRVESFDAAKRRTGALAGFLYPAAPDFFQRYALDLSTLKPTGAGKFQPTAPFVQFAFEISDAAHGASVPPGGEYQLRVDNVNYAAPAYYVSPAGSDASDGRTERTAFASPQKALDRAQPGDIVVLMEGTYRGGQANVAVFRRPGTPDAWITLKNYPGQHPTLTSTGWNIVSITDGSKAKPSDIPSLAYLEIRGLHIRGEGDVARTKYPEAMKQADSRTNTNGIAVDGRFMKNVPHHLRIADNLVEYCPAGGIGSIEGDWITVENNTCRCNCWTTIYATSGISVMGASNFDASDNIYRVLVRNNICYRNETFEFWKEVNRPSDGNGIILDVNQKTATRPTSSFRGRTLVQSNLCFDNGGSGIHTVSANRVDIINNTAYLNSASKSLEYSQIFAYGSEDVRIINNILVAPIADLAAGEKPEPVNASRKSPTVLYAHNLYFGGNIPPTMGVGDVIADPLFVNPSRDGKASDFHLRPDSPAIGKGASFPFAPFLDLDGKSRKAAPAKGAYEK